MLAAPDRIDLGDVEVGRVGRREELVFNLAGSEAFLDARMHGDPAIVLERAPSVLRPSGEGFDPTKAFGFVLQPAAKGHVASTLSVTARWGAGGPAEQRLTIPVVGAAHVAGDPTLSDEEVEAAKKARVTADEQQSESRLKKQDEAVDAFLTTDFDVHAGDRQKLDDQTKRAEIALQTLFERRKLGVETARAQIEQYTKHVVHEEPSLASQLGYMALQAFGVAVVGQLAAALRPLIASAMSTTFIERVPIGPIYEHSVTPDSVVDLVTQSIKEIGKLVVKKSVHDASQPAGSSASTQTASVAEHGFFETQVSGLIDQNAMKATATTIKLHDVLLSQLAANPAGAIASMSAVADKVSAEADHAQDGQALQTNVHWLGYVQRRERTGLNGAFDRDTPVNRVAGLVDVRFKASQRDAHEPIVVESVRLDGVSRAVVRAVHGKPLSSLPVAVRAVSLFDAGATSVTVVRNQDGQIASTDNSTGGIGFSNWLSRRGGHMDNSVTSQAQGARALMAEEILPKSMLDLVEKTASDETAIGNDSDA